MFLQPCSHRLVEELEARPSHEVRLRFHIVAWKGGMFLSCCFCSFLDCKGSFSFVQKRKKGGLFWLFPKNRLSLRSLLHEVRFTRTASDCEEHYIMKRRQTLWIDILKRRKFHKARLKQLKVDAMDMIIGIQGVLWELWLLGTPLGLYHIRGHLLDKL